MGAVVHTVDLTGRKCARCGARLAMYEQYPWKEGSRVVIRLPYQPATAYRVDRAANCNGKLRQV